MGQYGSQHSSSYYDQLSGHSSSQGSSPSQHNATAEDLSIQRIASTFASDLEHMSDFSPMTTDTDTPPDFTPAMPLLPDLPTKSRKLLEDLGSKSIAEATSSGQARTSRSGLLQSIAFNVILIAKTTNQSSDILEKKTKASFSLIIDRNPSPFIFPKDEKQLKEKCNYEWVSRSLFTVR